MSNLGEAQPVLVRALSFHAGYLCQNSGVCCSSGWEIAVEHEVELKLAPRLAQRSRSLPPSPDGFVPMSDPPAGCRSAFRRDEAGVCWFRDAERRDCSIHREFGEASLPSACRQFPRVVVLEPDQVSVSLSHYCPTAASLLFHEQADFALVEGPRAFPRDWPFEGLDARSTYSPLLRPGVLLGFDGLRKLEMEAVRALSQPGVDLALTRIEAAFSRLRGWRPADGEITRAIETAFGSSAQLAAGGSTAADPRPILLRSLASAGPEPPGPPEFSVRGGEIGAKVDLALRRYIAARLIAGWILFHADALSTVARYLRFCLDTARWFEGARPRFEPEVDRWREAIRSADLWIVHYCDPETLAQNLR